MMQDSVEFIDEEKIVKMLEAGALADDGEIMAILDKAENFEGLTPIEVAALLAIEKQELLERMFSIAGKIKEHIYGDRVVMFAPLYVSDYCVNNCDYCGFSCKCKFDRKKLTMDEVREEVKILEKMGHKRLALEAGEDPVNCSIEYILDCINTIYSLKLENGEIRRVNVNIAATTVEDYKKLLDVGIGTYILFQETYHEPTYKAMHHSGPKRNYTYHTTAFDRAMTAGIEDVGGGVLFGLYDYRFEVMGLMLHNAHLEEHFGVGFHTISVPRICEAPGNSLEKYKHLVDDETFMKIVAVLRLAVPFTGMIVSTRESAEMRKKVISMGVSQLSGGSSVEVGGYSTREKHGSQFSVTDDRSAGDIIYSLMDEGLIPSFCTACYRKGRTGDRFMSLAKSGNIKNVCLPNALMTLMEYSLDYGDIKFQKKAWELITSKIGQIENKKIYDLTYKNLALLKQGKRDLYI